ncbi:unnamed protein product [Paramecium octaurelia]|uniref:Uncharacterized protein n=1 Tax=Paramecium octaurelia TaxID=43137 RepID=A0A8S1XAI9_PAROT|nr:unnamed protein product [Paramecium octaurelia]
MTVINNNLFILQPLQKSVLFIYENINNGIKQEFKKIRRLKWEELNKYVNPFFLHFTILKKSSNLQECYCLNILSLSQIDQEVKKFNLEQIIECGTLSYGHIFGTLFGLTQKKNFKIGLTKTKSDQKFNIYPYYHQINSFLLSIWVQSFVDNHFYLIQTRFIFDL